MRHVIILGAVSGAIALSLAACGSSLEHPAVAAKAAPPTLKQYHSKPNGLVRFITAQFKRSDTNHDGVLSQSEIKASIIRDFKAMDVNHDGVLTLADIAIELKRAHRGKPTEPLNFYLPYDTNHDGKITQSEYVKAIMRTIMRPMDANHDGKITLREAINWHEKMLRTMSRPGSTP